VIRLHITENEAHCRCGCGLIANDGWLDTTDFLIDLCKMSIPISTMARCAEFNEEIGGVDDSPHLSTDIPYNGASDLKCSDPLKRWILMEKIHLLIKMGKINQVEVCNLHTHIAKVPLNHRLYKRFNWGISV